MSRSLSSTRLGPVDSSERSGLLPPSARMTESLEAMVGGCQDWFLVADNHHGCLVLYLQRGSCSSTPGDSMMQATMVPSSKMEA
ncbi:hypothetical protein EYF80_001472 [Liparis tanakae]|uniref:Uncharacterized protein n=1 Tax=Liparis tanakae TaxID=230148 RepID=A0A4Z2JDD3_9TELE|nr:hypothetical protein EYF80_001472 [Liparis tanakae]